MEEQVSRPGTSEDCEQEQIGLPKLLKDWKDKIQKKDLPIIRIVSEEEEMFVKLGLEMEDSTHDMLVKWGKEIATDDDYIQIAIHAGLKDHLDQA